VSEVPDEFADLAGMIARAEQSAERQRVDEVSPEIVAARRRRRKRRLITTGIIALVITAVIGTYIPVMLLTPVERALATASDVTVAIPDAASISLPGFGASAVSVTGAEQFPDLSGTGGILASSGGNEPRPIASITKIVTALVILDAHPIGADEPGPSATFSEADEDLYDEYYVRQASVWPLEAGSTIALREALRVMLVVSATNYADALSGWAFESRAGFRSAAASWLAAHGLSGTTIVEPTGLDPRNLSTPTDLIAIGRLVMANPVLVDLVGTPGVVAENGVGASNTNGMLGNLGINGIKTGTLDASGACLLFSAVVDVGHGLQLSVIGVVLGGETHYQVNHAVNELLNSLKAGFRDVPVLTEGQKLGTYTTPWGAQASAVAKHDASVFTWSSTPVSWTMTTDAVGFAESGTEVGQATFVSADAEVTVPIVLDGPLEEPDAWWRLTHPREVLGL
jgi:D-alanyl-D-alanine carboxypeptidase (penicillin-binding protein 5/6)